MKIMRTLKHLVTVRWHLITSRIKDTLYFIERTVALSLNYKSSESYTLFSVIQMVVEECYLPVNIISLNI